MQKSLSMVTNSNKQTLFYTHRLTRVQRCTAHLMASCTSS